jgi:hypothetical protein
MDSNSSPRLLSVKELRGVALLKYNYTMGRVDFESSPELASFNTPAQEREQPRSEVRVCGIQVLARNTFVRLVLFPDLRIRLSVC